MNRIGFIGMGAMGSSLIEGFLDSKALTPLQLIGYDPSENRQLWAKNKEIEVSDALTVVDKSDIVFICVKPQIVENVIGEIKDALKGKAIVSIVLKYDFQKYETMLNDTRHLTIMPNTPVKVLEGVILVEETHSLTDEEYGFVKGLFESVATVVTLPSQLMGVGGALSGCGPAYIYMVIEALADGAVAMGLPREAAYKLASQTVIGSGKMQLSTGLHPGMLKDQVTSPKGSTIKGVEALESENMRYAFIKAIKKSME